MNKVFSLFYIWVFRFCQLILGSSRPSSDPARVSPFGSSSPVSREDGQGEFSHVCFYQSSPLESPDRRRVRAVFVPNADCELPEPGSEVAPGENGFDGVWYACDLRWIPRLRPSADVIRDLKPRLQSGPGGRAIPLGGGASQSSRPSGSAIHDGEEDLFVWSPIAVSGSTGPRSFLQLGYGSSKIGHCLGMPALACAVDRLIATNPESAGMMVCAAFAVPYIDGQGFVFGSMSRAGLLQGNQEISPSLRKEISEKYGSRYRTAYYLFRRTIHHGSSTLIQDEWCFGRERAKALLSSGHSLMTGSMSEAERARQVLTFAPRDFKIAGSRTLDILEHLGSQVNPLFRGEKTDLREGEPGSSPMDRLVLHPSDFRGLTRVPFVKAFGTALAGLIAAVLMVTGGTLVFAGKAAVEAAPEGFKEAATDFAAQAVDLVKPVVTTSFSPSPSPWSGEYQMPTRSIINIHQQLNPLDVSTSDPIAVRGTQAWRLCFRRISQMKANPWDLGQGIGRPSSRVHHLACGGVSPVVVGRFHRPGLPSGDAAWSVVPGPSGDIDLPRRKPAPLLYSGDGRVLVPQDSFLRDWIAGKDPAKLLSCGPVSFWGKLVEAGFTAEEALGWLMDGKRLGKVSERMEVEVVGRSFVHQTEEVDRDVEMRRVFSSSGGVGVALAEVLLSARFCRTATVFEVPSRRGDRAAGDRYPGNYRTTSAKPPYWAAIPFEIRSSRIAEMRRNEYRGKDGGIFREGSPFSFHALYYDRDPYAIRRPPITQGRAEGGVGQYIWRLVGWFLLELAEGEEGFREEKTEFPAS